MNADERDLLPVPTAPARQSDQLVIDRKCSVMVATPDANASPLTVPPGFFDNDDTCDEADQVK